MQSTGTAPLAYIERDVYRGRHMVTRTTDETLGRRTAAWLAEHIGEGNVGVIWEYSGRTHNERLLYVRTRFVARAGALYGYDSDGVCKVIHPADRMIGFLSGSAA